MKIAHAPLLALLTELMEEAAAAGKLRPGINPKRMAAMTMQTVMFNARSRAATTTTRRATRSAADEVWDFCAHGFAG